SSFLLADCVYSGGELAQLVTRCSKDLRPKLLFGNVTNENSRQAACRRCSFFSGTKAKHKPRLPIGLDFKDLALTSRLGPKHFIQTSLQFRDIDFWNVVKNTRASEHVLRITPYRPVYEYDFAEAVQGHYRIRCVLHQRVPARQRVLKLTLRHPGFREIHDSHPVNDPFIDGGR